MVMKKQTADIEKICIPIQIGKILNFAISDFELSKFQIELFYGSRPRTIPKILQLARTVRQVAPFRYFTKTMAFPFTATMTTDLPILAIDLGYSANNRSCGFAHSDDRESHNMRFGDCIEATVQRLKIAGPHLLILEAVLSTYHRPDGNPDIRGEFERGRGWYYGPGVATYAGAQRFLLQLEKRLPKLDHPIPLVEGLLSFKKHRTEHCDDARRMLEAFETAEQHEAQTGSEPILPSIDGAPRIYKFNQPN
jgi:hypothetical protein